MTPLAPTTAPSPLPRVNLLKAIVPIFPLAFLYVVSPFVDKQVPTAETRLIGIAMLLGAALAVLTEPREILHLAESFFDGAGYGFGHIVSLIVTANCFGEGLKLIGLGRLFGAHLSDNPMLLIPAAGIVSMAFAFLCGSGMATVQSLFGFFAGPALKMGLDPTHVGAVMSLSAAAGRTASPVSAVTLMTAELTGVPPFRLVRLVIVPLLAAVAAIILAATVWPAG